MVKLKVGFNDLESQRPAIAAEWDADLNDGLLPCHVSVGSGKKVWWKCSSGHSWKATVDSRVSRGRGCAVCAGQLVLAGTNDLATTHPALAAEWSQTKNGGLLPTEVVAGTGKKFWWVCASGHEWQATGNSRIRPTGCPFCAGQRAVRGVNDLASLNPGLVREFHPFRNGKIDPSELLPNSNRMVWWVCSNGHEWRASPATRQKHGCPVCAGKMVWPGENDLLTTHPAVAAEWNTERNTPLTPRSVMIGSHRKVWWKCALGHEWEAKCYSRLVSGCPVCAGRRVLAGYNDIVTLHPEIVLEWDIDLNRNVAVETISRGTNSKYWWTCDQGHHWMASPANRTKGRGCPKCAKHGFNTGRPGVLYFIANEILRARKIGITNTDELRLAKFGKIGWVTLQTVECEDGEAIRALESMLLRWIREDQELAIFLGPTEMERVGGWTETFSMDGPTDNEVLDKIQEFRSQLNL